MFRKKVKQDRPKCCPEKSCECVYSCGDVNTLQKGFSLLCFGKMKEKTLLFKANGVKHDNEYFLCFWTPFRGWVKFTVDDNDMCGFETIIRYWREMKVENIAIETNELGD